MGQKLRNSNVPPSRNLDKKLVALAGAAALAPVAAHATGITYVPNVDTTVNQGSSYSFNLSGASSADVVLSASLGTNGSDPANTINFATNNNAAVDGFLNAAGDLSFGDSIDPNSSPIFWKSSGLVSSYDLVSTESEGFWSPGEQAYLGFYFEGTGGPQAGWADISLDSQDASFEVLSYAFEDAPNTPIAAGQTVAATPEPSTIALLALGAAGLIALRRRAAVQ